jgi:hypothetical protein
LGGFFAFVGATACSLETSAADDAARDGGFEPIRGDSAPIPANDAASDGGVVSDAHVGSDGSVASDGSALPFACAITSGSFRPNACPAPSGAAGQVSFCFRPGWSGVKGVDVYGGFGQAGDWTQPFVTLIDDGSGTFVATTALASGTYPYMFRIHGGADGVTKDGQYLLDQQNPQFVPAPPQAPLKRSVSAVTVPQVAAPIVHLRGKVTYGGAPQPCFAVDLEAGELRKPGGGVLSEHTTANFAESDVDGAFDFPVAAGPLGVTVRFPFKLDGDAGYPSPLAFPSVGVARTGVTAAGADLVLDPVDVAYSSADYAAMAPTSGAATLPVTFTFSLVKGSTAAAAAVISTNIAGNDPGYESAFGTTTSLSWDGTLGNGSKVKSGTTYYWGAWQKSAPGSAGTVWTSESLLFPISFQ